MIIEDLWYKNTIIYNLDVGTFMDANGDGVGDFEGLMRRLDHLEYLGVEAVWLEPFQPSPDRDAGYDVRDYFGVDPRHGSSGDFVEFMQHAKQRGIKVMMDLVVNHTSDEHPWFQASRRHPEGRYGDWYVWSKKRPKNIRQGMVFPGYQDATWDFDQVRRAWYFHRFYDFQPDLNLDEPEVREEIRRIIGYWIQQGVAGFRVDAVPFLIESTDAQRTGTPDLHFDYLYEMHRFMQWRKGDAILLGEANVKPAEVRPYFGGGDGLHMMFNFWVNQHLFLALADHDPAPLAQALRDTRSLPELSQWATFLRNHDELDLGRLSDEQRARVFARFAPDPAMQLYGRGIRRRLAPMLGDRRLIELAYSLLFSLPGSPVIRYGEEIGMGDDLSLDQRNSIRTVMQWSGERNAGFSTVEKMVRPLIADGVYGYERVNVADQRRDPGSLLNWIAGMIRVRKECPEIGWGSWRLLPTGLPDVFAMEYEWRGGSLVVLHNFGDRPRIARVRPRAENAGMLADLRMHDQSRADARGVHRIELEPFGYRWMRGGGMGHRAEPGRVDRGDRAPG